MTDDLVKRAKEACGHDGGPELIDLICDLVDHIEALTAERDSLLSGHRILNIDGARLQDRAEKAEADNVRLKAVLWKWLYWSVHNTGKETSHN